MNPYRSRSHNRNKPIYVMPGEVVKALNVCSTTLRRMAMNGKIDYIETAGGQFRYNLDGYLAKNAKSK